MSEPLNDDDALAILQDLEEYAALEDGQLDFVEGLFEQLEFGRSLSLAQSNMLRQLHQDMVPE